MGCSGVDQCCGVLGLDQYCGCTDHYCMWVCECIAGLLPQIIAEGSGYIVTLYIIQCHIIVESTELMYSWQMFVV